MARQRAEAGHRGAGRGRSRQGCWGRLPGSRPTQCSGARRAAALRRSSARGRTRRARTCQPSPRAQGSLDRLRAGVPRADAGRDAGRLQGAPTLQTTTSRTRTASSQTSRRWTSPKSRRWRSALSVSTHDVACRRADVPRLGRAVGCGSAHAHPGRLLNAAGVLFSTKAEPTPSCCLQSFASTYFINVQFICILEFTCLCERTLKAAANSAAEYARPFKHATPWVLPKGKAARPGIISVRA